MSTFKGLLYYSITEAVIWILSILITCFILSFISVFVYQTFILLSTYNGWVNIDTHTVFSVPLNLLNIDIYFNFFKMPYMLFSLVVFTFFVSLVILMSYFFFIKNIASQVRNVKRNSSYNEKIEITVFSVLPVLIFTPSIISLILIIYSSWQFGALSLLLLFILSNQIRIDDISIIEHKLDTLSKALINNSNVFEKYKLIHQCNHDHEIPLNLDESEAILSSIRLKVITRSEIINSITKYILVIVWLIKFILL